MANKAYEYYKGLPPWARGVVFVGGFAVVVLVAMQIRKSIKSKQDIKDANKISDQASKEIAALTRKGQGPNYSASQYEAWSLKLAEAMNGCGTDEAAIYDVFGKLKNKADVLQLINSFGIRYYMPCAATQPISYIRYMNDDKTFGGTLPTWFEYDLTSGEIAKVNDTLKKNNIDYTF